MISRGVCCWPQEGGEMFARAQAFTTTPGQNGWTIADTSSSGTPTYLCVTEDGGAAKLTLASTSEVENVCLYQNDVLPLDLAMLQSIEFIAKAPVVTSSATTITFGLCTARNDDPDATTVNAQFKLDGSVSTSAVVVETDDGTSDLDDKATGKTLDTTYRSYKIDFTNGLANVRFFIDGERVADSTTFTLANITSGQNVQPFVQIQKTSSADVSSIQIARISAMYKYAYGA